MDEDRQQVFVVGDLVQIERLPELGFLTFQHAHLGHHVDVGRGNPGLGGLLQLDQPGLSGGFGHGLDFDAGLFGEIGEDVLVEGILEIAAVDADLEGFFGRQGRLRDKGDGRAKNQNRQQQTGFRAHGRPPR